MKTLRLVCTFLAFAAAATAAFAVDPTGTWKWTTRAPNAEIETTLKLELKDGKLTGAYSNQFGDTAISDASFSGDEIAFDVVRDLGGNKYVVKYRGKIEADAIKGTIEAPRPEGGEAMKLDWLARRAGSEKPAIASTESSANSAASAVDVSGTWNLAVEFSGGSGNPVFTFAQNGGKLTGHYGGALGEAKVTGTLKGREIAFSFTLEGQTEAVNYSGTVDGDTMKGKVTLGSFGEGTFTGKKQAAK